jgi:hypothetical protein
MFTNRRNNMKGCGLVFACMMAVTQYAGAQEYSASASDFARLYVGAMEPQYQRTLWRDVPYYKTIPICIEAVSAIMVWSITTCSCVSTSLSNVLLFFLPEKG